MRALRCTASTLRRIALGRGFWGACLGLAAMRLLSVYQEISISQGMENSVLYFYELGDYVNFWVLYLLFAAIPGATLFCADWENRFLRFTVARCSKAVYGVSTAWACFLSAVLATLIGEGLFVAALRCFFPFTGENVMGVDASIFRVFLSPGMAPGYFLCRAAIKAAGAGFFAVFALWLSTKITNAFVALASPVILYYLWENVAVITQMPRFLQIGSLLKGHIQLGGSLLWTMLYPLLLFSALAAVFGVCFTINAKRRVENG